MSILKKRFLFMYYSISLKESSSCCRSKISQRTIRLRQLFSIGIAGMLINYSGHVDRFELKRIHKTLPSLSVRRSDRAQSRSWAAPSSNVSSRTRSRPFYLINRSLSYARLESVVGEEANDRWEFPVVVVLVLYWISLIEPNWSFPSSSLALWIIRRTET